jgi:PHD/YefM family antitoxin component YafN of YafNO toxin-antitoxin module
MKTVNLAEEPLDLAAVLKLARQEPVLLLTPDGKEFVLTEADDFEREVESLRKSRVFQRFLEERSKDQRRIPLEEIEQELSKGEPA